MCWITRALASKYIFVFHIQPRWPQKGCGEGWESLKNIQVDVHLHVYVGSAHLSTRTPKTVMVVMGHKSIYTCFGDLVASITLYRRVRPLWIQFDPSMALGHKCPKTQLWFQPIGNGVTTSETENPPLWRGPNGCRLYTLYFLVLAMPSTPRPGVGTQDLTRFLLFHIPRRCPGGRNLFPAQSLKATHGYSLTTFAKSCVELMLSQRSRYPATTSVMNIH